MKSSRKMVLAVILFFVSVCGYSQSVYENIASDMRSINKVYDSAYYLTFNLNMIYHSDTLWANTDSVDFRYSEMEGIYTFHGKKAHYRLGNMEFLQNDSFSIAMYKDDQFILVGRPVALQNPMIFLPSKAESDSAWNQLGQNFNVQLIEQDSLRQIIFTSLDTTSEYEKIVMEYDPVTYHVRTIQCRKKDFDYDYNETVGTTTPPITIRKADLTFQFSNYRVEEIGDTVFSSTKYLFFDGPDDIKPADAFRSFTIYKNY
jgi:hypothetical protein